MENNHTAAVVGTGFIDPVHVEGLRRAGVQVAGIAGSTPQRSIAAARQLGLPRGLAEFPGGHNEGFPDTFKQLFRAFYGYLAGGGTGRPPFPTFADGHREILLCEAILRSHRRRAWVDVG